MHRKAISLFFGAATIAGTVAMGGAAEAATPNSATADVTHHVVWQSGNKPTHVPNHGFNTYSFNGVSWRNGHRRLRPPGVDSWAVMARTSMARCRGPVSGLRRQLQRPRHHHSVRLV